MKNKELKKAQKVLADFLKQNTHLIPYQEELERRLSKALTPDKRMEIIQFMMVERLDALGKEVAKMPKAIKNEMNMYTKNKEVQKVEEKGT